MKNEPLTLRHIRKVVEQVKKTPVVTTIKMETATKDLVLAHIPAKPTHVFIGSISGIAVLTDDSIPPGRAKFIYTDGSEVEIDL